MGAKPDALEHSFAGLNGDPAADALPKRRPSGTRRLERDDSDPINLQTHQELTSSPSHSAIQRLLFEDSTGSPESDEASDTLNKFIILAKEILNHEYLEKGTADTDPEIRNEQITSRLQLIQSSIENWTDLLPAEYINHFYGLRIILYRAINRYAESYGLDYRIKIDTESLRNTLAPPPNYERDYINKTAEVDEAATGPGIKAASHEDRETRDSSRPTMPAPSHSAGAHSFTAPGAYSNTRGSAGDAVRTENTGLGRSQPPPPSTGLIGTVAPRKMAATMAPSTLTVNTSPGATATVPKPQIVKLAAAGQLANAALAIQAQTPPLARVSEAPGQHVPLVSTVQAPRPNIDLQDFSELEEAFFAAQPTYESAGYETEYEPSISAEKTGTNILPTSYFPSSVPPGTAETIPPAPASSPSRVRKWVEGAVLAAGVLAAAYGIIKINKTSQATASSNHPDVAAIAQRTAVSNQTPASNSTEIQNTEPKSQPPAEAKTAPVQAEPAASAAEKAAESLPAIQIPEGAGPLNIIFREYLKRATTPAQTTAIRQLKTTYEKALSADMVSTVAGSMGDRYIKLQAEAPNSEFRTAHRLIPGQVAPGVVQNDPLFQVFKTEVHSQGLANSYAAEANTNLDPAKITLCRELEQILSGNQQSTNVAPSGERHGFLNWKDLSDHELAEVVDSNWG